MKLRDVMTPNPHTLGPNATVQEAARLMRDEDTGVGHAHDFSLF